MPKISGKSANDKYHNGRTGVVQDTIAWTESEYYHIDRENFYNGKRTIEIPDDNRYSMEQRVDNGKN